MGEVIRLDDPDIAVRFARSSRARRFTLSLRAGEALLTAPAQARESEARKFLLRQSDWLRDTLARAPAPQPVAIGARLPIGGATVEIVGAGRARGACRLADGVLEAPEAATAAAVAAFLKARAQATLAPAAHGAAAALGRRIGRISLRDTRSRWGSCTARGDLSFSWRLAMAPPEVAAYVAIHEAAHLVEMNHGPEFWRLVARLRPDYRVQRAWLRSEGATLHRWRFEGVEALA
jgi:predicted metal-dependent hydrolase